LEIDFDLGERLENSFESLKKISFSKENCGKTSLWKTDFEKSLEFLEKSISWEWSFLEKINDFMMQMTWVNGCPLKRFSEELVGKCALSPNKSFTYSDCGHEYVQSLFDLMRMILKNFGNMMCIFKIA
jgi:hypothetical protein